MEAREIEFEDLVSTYTARPGHMMWFLGAGASRTAGMPTATDLIRELKLRQYCREENQDPHSLDMNSPALRERIQSYFDSKEAPPEYDNAEYSYFFECAFGDDYAAQQRFLQEKLNPQRVSLNVGHRVLGALIAIGAARVVFTTNFDNVVEEAVASVSGKSLVPFHLEGSYAALEALNTEEFPIYAKLHGDFRFKSVKNLSADLVSNDEQIQRCFLAAASRFGMVVSGYSGRDANVMAMLRRALDYPNAFPAGLFWTVPRRSDASGEVIGLIDEAKGKGVRAGIVETGTFDILMSRIWRQIPGKTPELIAKVRPAYAQAVSIPLPMPGGQFPILRTNALPITSLPTQCGHIVCRKVPTYDEVRSRRGGDIPISAFAIDDGLLYWGSRSEVETFVPTQAIVERTIRRFHDPVAAIKDSMVTKALFEEALAKALCTMRPVVLRKKGRELFAVASNRSQDAALLTALRRAIGGPISGRVPGRDATWSEAVSIRLEERNGMTWLLLRPDIWVSPVSKRDEAKEFIRARKLRRWNSQANELLDAWIRILLGEAGGGESVTVTAFANDDQPVSFRINTRTAYSAGGRTGVR